MSNDIVVSHAQNNQIIPIADLKVMADAVAKSHLFGGIDTPDKALCLMLLSQSEGKHPIQCLREYHIIDAGKGPTPSMKADAMLAKFKERGGKVKWSERSDSRVSATFEKDGDSQVITWDLKMAASAGLSNKSNWKSYPRQMLTSRVISEGVRLMDPAVCIGIFTTEEVQDFDSTPPSKPLFKAPDPVPEAVVVSSAPTVAANSLPQTAPVTPVLVMPAQGPSMGYTSPAKTTEEIVEEMINLDPKNSHQYLVDKGWIKPDQSWEDMDVSRKQMIASNGEKFLAAIARNVASKIGKPV